MGNGDSTTRGRTTVMVYPDKEGKDVVMPTDSNWTVRDCVDSPGPILKWATAHGHVSVSYRDFDIMNNRTCRLRFGPNAAPVFVAAGGDKLSDFVIESVNYPVARWFGNVATDS